MGSSTWLDRRVIAYAHQGGARESPSSTLYAIERALEAGATAIELDVHATADRHLVVCHDPTLDRTTDGTGAIADHRLVEIALLDNAYFFVPGEDARAGLPESDYPLRGRAPVERDFGVATLSEVLERFPGVVLNLDIKRTAPQVEPYEALLAAELRAHGRADDVIVASFSDTATAAFSAEAPEFAISAGTLMTGDFYRRLHAGEPPPPGIDRFAALQVPPRYGDIELVDARFVEAAHDVGLAVHVWTIDDEPEMERLVDLGVDGIISDVPSVLAAALARRGVAWRP